MGPMSPATAHVLFVCTGNICRSPFAERLASHIAAGLPAGQPAHGWRFSSAGIGALVGDPMDAAMAAELAARGGDPSGFTARQLTARLARDADLILALEPAHREWVLDEWPGLVRRTLVLGQAARAAVDLDDDADPLRALLAHRGAVQASDGIRDPYRRGPAAAQEAAARIERALRAVMGADPGRTPG